MSKTKSGITHVCGMFHRRYVNSGYVGSRYILNLSINNNLALQELLVKLAGRKSNQKKYFF